MVVTDPDGEDVFVVMGLDQYESLIEEPLPEKQTEPEIWDTMKPAGEEGETWDLSQMGEEELAELEEQYRQFANRNVETAIAETNKIEDVPDEKPKDSDDFGEEQFYLEPIE